MSDDLKATLEKVIGLLLPEIGPTFLGAFCLWKYTVTSVSAGPPVLISASPSGASPFGPLANVVLLPGPDGGYAVPAGNSNVTIGFLEGNPSFPYVAFLDPNSTATLATLGGASGAKPSARENDPVGEIYLNYTLNPSTGDVSVIAPGMGVAPAVPIVLTGSITGGSSKLQVGT